MNLIDNIYLDYQASTPVEDSIFEKMLPYFREKAGNPHSSSHSVGWKSSQAVFEAQAQISNLLGADPDEIIFTSGATESNNLALTGLSQNSIREKRNRILVSSIEHKCVLSVAHALREKYNFRIDKIPVDEEGKILIDGLTALLDEEVALVSIMAVNNEIGTIQDIKSLGDIIHSHGALFHCDAAQAPLAIELDTFANHADLISLSGQKMYGPQGIGALYIRRDLQKNIDPLILGGGQQNGLRSGTLPTPLCVGLGAACEFFSGEKGTQNRNIIREKRDTFWKLLTKLPWDISPNGPHWKNRHPGNINVLFKGFFADEILNTLQPRLAASTGSACTSGIQEPSHVLKAIGLSSDDADSSIRFSFGLETTDQEIEAAVNLIAEALKLLSHQTGMTGTI